MPTYKLTYFDFDGGRGEPVRIALHAAGIEFEDERLSFEEFGEMRHTLRFSSLPALEIDGNPVTQSNAILRYIGKMAGLYPEDDLQALYCDEVLDANLLAFEHRTGDAHAAVLGPSLDVTAKIAQLDAAVLGVEANPARAVGPRDGLGLDEAVEIDTHPGGRVAHGHVLHVELDEEVLPDLPHLAFPDLAPGEDPVGIGQQLHDDHVEERIGPVLHVAIEGAVLVQRVALAVDLLGIDPPNTIKGVEQFDMDGVSLAHTLGDADGSDVHTIQYFEMFGCRSIYHDGWRAENGWPGPNWTEGAKYGKKQQDPIHQDLSPLHLIRANQGGTQQVDQYRQRD